MYKLVKTIEEEMIFDGIWKEAWLEKGFELEWAEEVLDRCLVFDEADTPVATVEMKPYSREYSFLNEIAPFHEHPVLLADSGLVAEVDKVAVHKDHRGKNLDRLLATIVMYAETNHIRHYVTLLEPLLFRALRISFHVPMSRVGERVFYKGGDVIPTIIHAADFYENKERYDWFKAIVEKEHSPMVAIHT
ncbi:hypothetical protein [Paenibacillus sp. DYY-L-2]|uniref:hypothetical protein n=1 Tax=Paenibacillus sp. DYY-L-2 TaxID=3447013 RepID=UPI003F4FD1FC